MVEKKVVLMLRVLKKLFGLVVHVHHQFFDTHDLVFAEVDCNMSLPLVPILGFIRVVTFPAVHILRLVFSFERTCRTCDRGLPLSKS